MAMDFKRRLPIPKEIREEMPLSSAAAARKIIFDRELAQIFTGESKRHLLVIGPCSADREDSVMDYIERLAQLQERVSDQLMIVPRIYTNKPRTNGTGYKGLLHNPRPDGQPDLLEGVKAIRHLHLRVAEESPFFTADEMLYPSNYQYLIDILAYNAVGARSVENQEHRLVASGIPGPVGLKNPTSGSLDVLLNSIYAAQQPQNFIYRNWEVQTSGNPLAHAVLRGYVALDGTTRPNYHYEDIERLLKNYHEPKFVNPAVIVDCNHDNSGKRSSEQRRICQSLIDSMRRSEAIRGVVRGWMVESYLVSGRQEPGGSVYGQSITDPCIGWEETEELVLGLAEGLASL